MIPPLIYCHAPRPTQGDEKSPLIKIFYLTSFLLRITFDTETPYESLCPSPLKERLFGPDSKASKISECLTPEFVQSAYKSAIF